MGSILKRKNTFFDRSQTSVPGVKINEAKQIELIKKFALYYKEFPFTEKKQENARYYYCNNFFGSGSAVILYSLMRHFRPRRIIEIGSGFSSAAMLDINDRFFDSKILFSFIEPYPERLLSLLTKNDKETCHIHAEAVQNSSNEIFKDLCANDILFIDSSHVAKIGSDVVHILTNILPALPPGVIIHFHDIYWPFEYPEAWILQGRAWNEAYILKAFLQFNSSFEILLFNSYLSVHHMNVVEEYLPFGLKELGGSLWLTKTS